VFDESTNRFTVASAGSVLSAEMPTQLAAAQSGVPTASTVPSASASSSPSPSAGTPSAPVAASPGPAAPTIGPNVLDQARLLSTGVYSLPLPNGMRPQFVAASGQRLWILDQQNRVSAFDMNTGDIFNIGSLRNGAHVSYWVAGGSYVFGVDEASGEINVVNTARERVEGRFATNVLSPVSAVAVGIDGRLWIGLRSASYLFVWDPKTQRMDAFDLAGTRITALAVDPQGRLFYADDNRGTVGTFDPRTSRLNEIPFARNGATTALMVDSTSTLWVGTSAGEVYSVRGGAAKLTVSLQRPVSAFAADQTGRAWYLAQLPSGLTGFSYAPADNREAPRSVDGPAQSLSFNAIGRAFLADPRGAFFMSVVGGR
jgi:ligand-binding sensor domain-containing protein